MGFILCSGSCGRPIWRSDSSAPNPLCQPCRRERLAAAPPCSDCGGPMTLVWRREWLRGRVELPARCGKCRLAHPSHRGNCSVCGKRVYLDPGTSLPEPICRQCRAALKAART